MNLERLRAERLARLQASMRAHDVDGCLLFNEPNIRYATGASAAPVWGMSTFVRCALVPAEGRPLLFEHPNSVHLSRRIAADVRPMRSWEFVDDQAAQATLWARETVATMRELGIASGRLAVDRLGTPGFLALERAGIALVDSAPVTQEAREVRPATRSGSSRRTAGPSWRCSRRSRRASRPVSASGSCSPSSRTRCCATEESTWPPAPCARG